MRRTIVGSSVLAVLCVVAFFSVASARPPQQAKAKNVKAVTGTYGNADSITEDEMKIYDYFLASDQLEGRYLPSRGYDTAALYVASHLAEWGLKPGGSTSGTNGPLQPYMMPFELVSHQYVTEDAHASATLPPVAVDAEEAVVVARAAGPQRQVRAPWILNTARIGPSALVVGSAAVAEAELRFPRSIFPALRWFSPEMATSSTRPTRIRTRVSTSPEKSSSSQACRRNLRRSKRPPVDAEAAAARRIRSELPALTL
jgi:hypothetical protein